MVCACTPLEQVLEGHSFLGSLPALGAEINACFGNVADAAALRAVQTVVDGQAGANVRNGLSSKVQTTPQLANMHDAAEQLPPELFKAALSRVRGVGVTARAYRSLLPPLPPRHTQLQV